MNIMVFDVPAESGGAISILMEYYKASVQDSDKSKMWYFVISLPDFPETSNVKIIRFPWVKKSWLHRLYFDYFIAPALVKKYKVNEILSLQNVIIPKVKVSQTLYVHQPLPFVDKKFKLTENLLFWVYQNIIGVHIFKSIKRADKIIVQTTWMKNACIDKTKINSEKITVVSPKINIKINLYFQPTYDNLHTFFYPASGFVYKNHKVIIEAAMLLKELGVNNYKIVFTLKGNENKHVIEFYRQVRKNNLPIEFIGEIGREQVFDYYSHSVLIFPSYIETFGLPMLEAKLHKTPVLASDCPFSHEILDGYENVRFFGAEDSKSLSNYMNANLQLPG